MPIPKGITLDDILEAAARLDDGELHDFGEPTGYLAMINGKPYSPKALVGLGANRLLGRKLSSQEFSSGLGPSQAVGYLRKLGVEVQALDSSNTPAAWLFQGNPDRFNIDEYLRTTKVIWWHAAKHGSLMRAGQTVYLWRTGGQARGIAGVVAVGVLLGEPVVQADHAAARPFWADADEAEKPASRVQIEVVDVASAKRVLKTKWLEKDPICSDLPNLRMRQGTNYPLEKRHAERLARLWFRSGEDFDRADLLLSLRAYRDTLDGPVSMLPGSPIARCAVDIGRAVTGVYAKVMNFRALDPRAKGEGQPNGGAATAAVWAEFFVGGEIDAKRLDAEIEALYSPGSTSASLTSLEAEASESIPNYPDEGHRRLVTHMRIERSKRLVAEVKARWFVADPLLRCCACRMSFAGTYGPIGEGYIEAHHVEPLAKLDGPKSPRLEDLAPVCANCHRMLHRRSELSIEGLRKIIESRDTDGASK